MPPLVTTLLGDLVRAFARRPPFLGAIDPDRILVVGTRGRAGPSGKRASCHFTRFRESGARTSADGRFRLPRIVLGGVEMRYVIAFVLPRFLFLAKHEQAEDVVHELLHIDPSFDGGASALRHGARYDALARRIAALGLADGVAVPDLAAAGETVLYARLRPFPRPYPAARSGARGVVDPIGDEHLEVTALHLDPKDREAPPPRFLYECPACGARYPRRRRLPAVSCGSCAPGYDGRFRLRLLDGGAGGAQRGGTGSSTP